MGLTVALIEPEIPGNTGSIARTCVATCTELLVVGPIPFEITDVRVKRAGLDYWPHLNWQYLSSWTEFLSRVEGRRLVLSSARTGQNYHEFQFLDHDVLILGKETLGLPKELLYNSHYPVITLPMWGKTRSLNQANACTVLLYEAYRQIGFPKV